MYCIVGQALTWPFADRNKTRTGWPRDLKTLRGALQIWNMFIEVKYLADNLSSCFEIVSRILKKGAKLTDGGMS